jgi:hypothetical protein
MKELDKRKKSFDNYVRYSGIGFQMLAIIAAGVFGGYKLDMLAGNKFPVFLILLSFFSVALSIYVAIKDFLKK